MTVYSYSRINTFFTCPAQFQFRYIERRPPPAAEGIELFLGSRFHEVMEYLYGQVPRRIPTVNELLEFFKNHWEKHWNKALQRQRERGFPEALRIVQAGQTVEDYFQKGQLYLENYYHQYQPFDQDETLGLELKVAFDLDEQGRYKMQGYIDRLGRDEEGTLWIHDYKTSSRKMSPEDARNEDQLALYQLGLAQSPKFAPREKVRLIWHYVAFEDGQVTAERNPKELEWLKKKYVSRIRAIEEAKSFPTKPGVLCQWCEYLTVCPDGQAWVNEREKNQDSRKVSSSGKGTILVQPPPSPATPPLSDEKAIPAAFSSPPSAALKPRKSKKVGAHVSSDQLSLF